MKNEFESFTLVKFTSSCVTRKANLVENQEIPSLNIEAWTIESNQDYE